MGAAIINLLQLLLFLLLLQVIQIRITYLYTLPLMIVDC
jgi:hypothetical protein